MPDQKLRAWKLWNQNAQKPAGQTIGLKHFGLLKLYGRHGPTQKVGWELSEADGQQCFFEPRILVDNVVASCIGSSKIRQGLRHKQQAFCNQTSLLTNALARSHGCGKHFSPKTRKALENTIAIVSTELHDGRWVPRREVRLLEEIAKWPAIQYMNECE